MRASRFVDTWVKHWNDHDLDRLLEHFSDDVTFTSPVAAQLLPDSEGVILGKAALRRYWEEGLRRIPTLHFEVVGVYTGVDTVVVNYRNQTGALVSEVLIFEGALVVEGHATYAHGDNPAWATA